MPSKPHKTIFCKRCNRNIDKYYYAFHCKTKKHLLGISSEKEIQLKKKYTQCILIFD